MGLERGAVSKRWYRQGRDETRRHTRETCAFGGEAESLLPLSENWHWPVGPSFLCCRCFLLVAAGPCWSEGSGLCQAPPHLSRARSRNDLRSIQHHLARLARLAHLAHLFPLFPPAGVGISRHCPPFFLVSDIMLLVVEHVRSRV